MKPTTRLVSLIAIAASTPLAAQQGSVQDFQLPPAPTPTPTQQPQVQGPVDTEGVVPVGPRVIPSDTPTPSTTEPAPSQATPPPSPQPMRTAPAQPRPQPQVQQPDPVRTASTPIGSTPTDSDANALPLDLPTNLPTSDATTTTASAAIPAPSISRPDAFGIEGEAETSGILPWLLALIAALAAAAAGWWFWRQRQPALANVPLIEPPLARRDLVPPPEPDTPVPTPAAQIRAGSSGGLAISATPVHLSRSMRFARFSYRLTFRNAGATALENVSIGADLIAAHGSVPVEQQVASPAVILPETGKVGSIAPGEEVEIGGEVELPLEQVRPIRQGTAPLFIPLMRVRAAADGVEPVARTFIVGNLPGPGAKKLQPFRLDEMPQTYREIGVMALER